MFRPVFCLRFAFVGFLPHVTYGICICFTDDFSTDTTGLYTLSHLWTKGGTGRLVCDAVGQRAQLLSGDNISTAVLYEDMFATPLHPNGFGYQAMADLWFENLTR